jgi:hypothetical protein
VQGCARESRRRFPASSWKCTSSRESRRGRVRLSTGGRARALPPFLPPNLPTPRGPAPSSTEGASQARARVARSGLALAIQHFGAPVARVPADRRHPRAPRGACLREGVVEAAVATVAAALRSRAYTWGATDLLGPRRSAVAGGARQSPWSRFPLRIGEPRSANCGGSRPETPGEQLHHPLTPARPFLRPGGGCDPIAVHPLTPLAHALGQISSSEFTPRPYDASPGRTLLNTTLTPSLRPGNVQYPCTSTT